MKFSPYPAQFVTTLQKLASQQGDQQQQKGRGKQDPPELQAAKLKKTEADVQKTLAQARALDSERGQKTAELFLEGLKLSHDVSQKRQDRSHKKVIDTLQVIQSLMGR